MNRKIIEGSRYESEVIELLESGWSCRSVADWLRTRFPGKVMPSYRTIAEYRQRHTVEAQVIPPKLLKKLIGRVDGKIDLLAHTSRLVLMAEGRVIRGLQAELLKTKGIPLHLTDDAMQTYLASMTLYMQVAERFGIVPRLPLAPLIDARTQALVVDSEVAEQIRDFARGLAQRRGISDSPPRCLEQDAEATPKGPR